MKAIGLSDISPSKGQNLDPHSVQWVKSNIKAYNEPGQSMDTNGFGECRFVGATRKAKAKVWFIVCFFVFVKKNRNLKIRICICFADSAAQRYVNKIQHIIYWVCRCFAW